MAENARMLLKEHRMCCARAKILEAEIRQAEQKSGLPSDDYLIETIVFARTAMDGMPRASGYGSRTESAALKLDDERLRAKREENAKLWAWKVELNRLKHEIALYNVVFNMLSFEERALVIRHYQNEESLERIANTPLLYQNDYPKSVSTLRRMLSRVLKKVQNTIDAK